MSPEQSQYIWRKTISHIEVGMGSGVFTSIASARFGRWMKKKEEVRLKEWSMNKGSTERRGLWFSHEREKQNSLDFHYEKSKSLWLKRGLGIERSLKRRQWVRAFFMRKNWSLRMSIFFEPLHPPHLHSTSPRKETSGSKNDRRSLIP